MVRPLPLTPSSKSFLYSFYRESQKKKENLKNNLKEVFLGRGREEQSASKQFSAYLNATDNYGVKILFSKNNTKIDRTEHISTYRKNADTINN